MFTGRSYGGTPVMSSPSMKIRPERRGLEAAEHAQQRGLAAARRSQQTKDLALIDVEAHVIDRLEITEGLGDALDPHVGRGGRIPPRGGFDGSAGVGHRLLTRLELLPYAGNGAGLLGRIRELHGQLLRAVPAADKWPDRP